MTNTTKSHGSKLRGRRAAVALGATIALGAGAFGAGAYAAETSFSTSAKTKSGSPSTLPTVTNLRYSSNTADGHDRVVIDLDGKATGYDVRYVTSPTFCGSGDAVSMPSNAKKYLQVTVRPANAHTDSGSNTYVGPGRLSTAKLSLGTVKAVRKTCDFEGHVSFVLGLDYKASFRVGTLSSPNRVYIDIKH